MRTTYRHIIVRSFFAYFLFLASGCSNTRPSSTAEQVINAVSPNASFLFLSDIHLNTQSDTTVYGDDTGLGLWNNFLQKAGAVLTGPNPPQFILYTGDLPAHYSCNPSCYLAPGNRAVHNQDLTAILTGLRNLADKYKKPLFYLPGNNDGLAGDYYSFADERQQTPLSLVPSTTNPYPALNIQPGNKAPCMISMPHPTMGYYSVRPVDGLRLICLNTVMYSKKFTTVDGTDKDTDRQAQMTWLGGQLADAYAKREKVYIAMHIPPGEDAYSGSTMWDDKRNWLNQFLTLTTQYQSSITGMFYGHTHMDELRRLYDTTGTNITEVAISCPGVTPQHNNNPGFKTVSYNTVTKEVMDFTTYYTTPGAGTWGSDTYSFKTVFSNLPSVSIYQRLSGMALSDITTRMGTIYTVKNGPPSYNIGRGIEVK